MPFIGKLSTKYGKKEMITAGLIWSTICYVAMLILPITPDGKGLIIYAVMQFLVALGAGIGSCLSWSMMADAMDWEEYKFGNRNEGTTYAMHSFFRKLAQGVGPSMGLVLATMLGYDAALGANQTAEVALTMKNLVIVMYIIAYAFQLLGYGLIFPMNKKKTAEVAAELAARKAK